MRTTNYSQLSNLFIDRWSPRSFKDQALSQEQIETLLEASRWSPSCYNEQPWRFAIADEAEKLAQFQSLLVERNLAWANKAPLLILLFSKKLFTHNGAPNNWNSFDAGAAWMALALQARQMGLYAHAMAGFDQQKAYQICQLDPQEYQVHAIIAVGYKDEPDRLPSPYQAMESPNGRKELQDLLIRF